MKRILWLFISTILILSISYIAYNYYQNDNIKISKLEKKEITNTKKVYNHTFPSRLHKNDYLKWEFVSNDIASIYPRRDALIRDILVDIWDNVNIWDTLATLFNPWVGWEWQSKINLKNTILLSKINLLEDLINVKNAKIAEIDQKIIENEVILNSTIKNFDSKISQIWNINTNWSEYSVQIKSLDNLQMNFTNAVNLKNELLIESKNNITQKEKILNSQINEFYSKIIPILYIWSSNELDYKDIKTSNFSDYLWAKNSETLKNLINDLISFNDKFNILNIKDKYEKLLEINNKLIVVLQNTVISLSSNITESILSEYISNINNYNTKLILQKEVLDDAENAYKILEVTQKEKIDNLELLILKKQNEIDLLWAKTLSTQSDKNLWVSKLKTNIDTLKKSRDLLIANEDKAITMLKNEIEIAKADLNNEWIKSWDYKIISPFKWTISKRWINIWDKISPNIEAFRLSWVDTTLSRITKKEIKFYIPESLVSNLTIWKEIEFSTPDNEAKTFTWIVYRISPEVDEDNLSITIQAKVEDSIRLPNKSTIRINLETKQEIFKIPSSTIYNKADRKIIYYKKDNWKLWIRDVNIISDDWEFSLITWNINDNLKIITTPIFIK